MLPKNNDLRLQKLNLRWEVRNALKSILRDERCTPEQRLEAMRKLEETKPKIAKRKSQRKPKQLAVGTSRLGELLAKVEQTA